MPRSMYPSIFIFQPFPSNSSHKFKRFLVVRYFSWITYLLCVSNSSLPVHWPLLDCHWFEFNGFKWVNCVKQCLDFLVFRIPFTTPRCLFMAKSDDHHMPSRTSYHHPALYFSSSVIFLLVDACVGLNWILVSFLSHVNKNIIHSFISWIVNSRQYNNGLDCLSQCQCQSWIYIVQSHEASLLHCVLSGNVEIRSSSTVVGNDLCWWSSAMIIHGL